MAGSYEGLCELRGFKLPGTGCSRIEGLARCGLRSSGRIERMCTGNRFDLIDDPKAGNYVPPVIDPIIPIVQFVTRLNPLVTLGSSSFGGTGGDATVDTVGNPVPAEFIGTTIQKRILKDTLPNDAGTAPLISTIAGYGVNTAGIRAGVQGEVAAGRHTGKDFLVQYGGNNTSATTGDKELIDAIVESDMLLAGQNLVLVWAYYTDAPDIIRKRGIRRTQKYYHQSTNRNHGFFSMSEAHNTWAGPTRTAGDIKQQAIGMRPASLRFDTAHDNGMGYAAIVDGGMQYAVGAINNGPAFIPTSDYFAKMTGPGFISNVHYIGNLSNTVVTCQTAGYAVAVAGQNIGLSLTGAVPKAGTNNVSLRVTRVPYNAIDYTIRTSISGRVGTAPAIVDMYNGFSLIEDAPFWTATSRKFSAVFIIQFTEDDGLSYNGRPAGGADTRTQVLLNCNGITIRRNASGTIGATAKDATDNNLNAFNNSGMSFRKDQGMRAIFVSYDADQPTLCKVYMSAGKLISTGATQALQSIAITPQNSGTIALNLAGTSYVLTASTIFGDGRPDNYAFSNNWFQGRKHNVWIASEFFDFSIQANRDLFFNETTQLAVDLGNDAGIVGGITPTIYLPGDAAELTIGSTLAYDSARGGSTAKNHGSYGDTTAFTMGVITTL